MIQKVVISQQKNERLMTTYLSVVLSFWRELHAYKKSKRKKVTSNICFSFEGEKKLRIGISSVSIRNCGTSLMQKYYFSLRGELCQR